MSSSIWLLPQGVSEILPNNATKLEALRRSVLDELQSREFSLVFPPMIEFLDNLIQGAGAELTTQTFKVPDYDSHKTLGIRADMTPQIAQIDAHRLSQKSVNMLCYIGTVLRTKPMTLGGSRELLQIGAEIFGDASIEADKRIVDAMLAVHGLSGSDKVTISFSHVGLFSALIEILDIDVDLSNDIYDALLRKSTPDIIALDDASNYDLKPFIALSKARGDASVLERFKAEMPNSEVISIAINELSELVQHIEKNSSTNPHVDLSELHGYRYHTGLTFQTFVAGEGRAIAKGGRYHGINRHNEIMKAPQNAQKKNQKSFSQSPRFATGFSADLKLLASRMVG